MPWGSPRPRGPPSWTRASALLSIPRPPLSLGRPGSRREDPGRDNGSALYLTKAAEFLGRSRQRMGRWPIAPDASERPMPPEPCVRPRAAQSRWGTGPILPQVDRVEQDDRQGYERDLRRKEPLRDRPRCLRGGMERCDP